MKQFIRGILLSAVVASALLTGALAEDQTGIKDVEAVDPTAVAEAKGEDWLTVTYNNAAEGKEYLLIVQKLDENDKDALPTQSNIYYIDQKTASGNSVSFDVYPKTMTSGTYAIRVSSNDGNSTGLQEVGTFAYFTTGPEFTVINLTGDPENGMVNKDTNVLTVTCDKACVVMYSESEADATENGVKDSVATDWVRLNAEKEGENTYSFDLSGVNGAVVIAVKGDYNYDSIINASDFAPLVLVSKGLDTITQLKKEICEINGDDVINASDFAPLVLVSKGLDALEWDLSSTK